MATVKSVSGDYTIIANNGAGTITLIGNIQTTTTPTTIAPFLIVAANNTGTFTDMGLIAQTGANAFAGLRFDTVANTWQVSPSVTGAGDPIDPYENIATGFANYGNSDVANFMPVFTGNIGTANSTPLTAIFANSYFYGNGDPFIGGGGGSYGNADVANYLPSYTGLIGANIGLQVTGVLLADTPPNGTSNTQVATTQFVVNAIGGGGGGTYGNANVANYLPTYTGFIGGNVGLTVTGNLSADTPANGTYTTQVATTEFVLNIIDGQASVADYLPTYTGNLNSLTGPVSTTNQIFAAGNINSNSLVQSLGGFTTFGNLNLNGNINFNSTNSAILLQQGNINAGNAFIQSNLEVDGSIFISNTGNSFSTPGNISGGGLFISNIFNVGGNTANIGSSANPFGTVFALATSALYADLAEMYSSDEQYTPATVLEFGGEAEVTTTTQAISTRVAGVVSTLPAYVMNQCQRGKHTVQLALTGRVPCRVTGKIQKGDLIVSSEIPGVAQALPEGKFVPGCVIGKALENYDGADVGTIEVVVGVR